VASDHKATAQQAGALLATLDMAGE